MKVGHGYRKEKLGIKGGRGEALSGVKVGNPESRERGKGKVVDQLGRKEGRTRFRNEWKTRGKKKGRSMTRAG